MDERDWLVEHFEEHRPHLRAVAYRMLGSLAEADEAVQDAWLRVSRAGADGIENLRGWLTTIVSRVCLNALQARKARPERLLSRLMQMSRLTAAAASRTKYQKRPPLSLNPARLGGSTRMPVEKPRLVSYSPPR